ncbi:uncharacterized protein TNCV_1272571 [Trichonephila clavipes]|nr:uncharacterized protein TNCV_1272571 [Trichonephila clavipes]
MTLSHFYSKHAPKTYNLDGRKQCLFCFGRKQWNYGEKHLRQRKPSCHVCKAKIRDGGQDTGRMPRLQEGGCQEEIEEEVVCGCGNTFDPCLVTCWSSPRLSRIRRFYDSLLEKPEMWEGRVTFQNGWGNDVWGMVQRYLRQDWMWFHIMVKTGCV